MIATKKKTPFANFKWFSSCRKRFKTLAEYQANNAYFDFKREPAKNHIKRLAHNG